MQQEIRDDPRGDDRRVVHYDAIAEVLACALVNMIHVLTALFRVSFFLRVLLPLKCNHVDRPTIDVIVVVVGFRVDRMTIVVYAVTRFIALHLPLSTDAVTRHRVSYEKL